MDAEPHPAVARHRVPASARIVCCLCLSLFLAEPHAAILVENSTTLTRETISLPGGNVAAYEYSIEFGGELVFSVQLARWRRNPLRVWLVDADNYDRLLAGQAFDYFAAGTGMIRREAQISFEVSETGRYFVVLDNSHSPVQRDAEVYAFVRSTSPSQADARAHLFYEAHFTALSELIDVGDIAIHVRRCGEVNAYAIGPRVVICRELDNLLGATATPGVRLFVLLHEVAHSLIDRWGYRSIVRNQFMVDRLAATLFAMVDRDGLSEQAAAWFMQLNAGGNESAIDESLIISKSRARRIADWLQEEGGLDRAWTKRIVLPRLHTAALEGLVEANHLDELSRGQIARELTQRQSGAASL